jgi:hypothetical protein
MVDMRNLHRMLTKEPDGRLHFQTEAYMEGVNIKMYKKSL